YPENAAINTWKRTIRLNRGKNVAVTDLVSLNKTNELVEHVMTCYPAELTKEGELVIHFSSEKTSAKDFVIRYKPRQMEVSVEKIPLTAMEDKGVLQKWGDNIYRINFRMSQPKAKDKINFLIAPK
ncbi:MAG TPA: heparinase, partial [Agriterribacter sp.]|nr:heparinase [Agriterribacter sp.]